MYVLNHEINIDIALYFLILMFKMHIFVIGLVKYYFIAKTI